MNAPSIALPGGRSLPSLLLHGGLIVAGAVFLWQLPFFFGQTRGEGRLDDVWYHGYVLVWMLVITVLGRTLPLRILAAAFFVGLFPCMAVALAIGFPLAGILGTDNRLFDSVLVPILETAVTSGPVLLFFWLQARRGVLLPSMTDGLLLGYLVGAGFAVHEDALHQSVFGAGFGGSLGFIFPTIQEPVFLRGGFAFGFYHAEWTALIGLSIGAAFFFRQRFRLSWLIPVVAAAVVWLDHASANYMIGEDGEGISDLLRAVDLDGRLPVILLVVGIVAAVVTEVLVLRTTARRDYLFKGISLATLLTWLRAGGVAGLRRIQAARVYIRARRSVHYALWRARPGGIAPEQVTAIGLMLLSLGERAGLTFAEPGTEEEPAPSPAPPASPTSPAT